MQNTNDHPMDDDLRTLREARIRQLTADPAPRLMRPLVLDDNLLDAAIAQHELLIVDVWAPWCGPCRVVGPILDELAGELAGHVTIGKINADKNQGVMQRYAIRGIPTMLAFKKGKLIDKIVGAAPKPHLRSRFIAYAND